MAGLTGQAVGVVVQALVLVRAQVVAGLAGRPVVVLVLHVQALGVLGGSRIAAAGGLVGVEGVAVGTGQIRTVGRHMHVDMLRRLDQRGVEVAVLDRVTAAAVEVAGAAVLPAGLAHRLRDLRQVGRLHDLAAALGHLARLVERMAGIGGDLLVGRGRVVAGQAIHVVLVGEIVVLVRPAVASVATRAARLIGEDRAAEIVGRVLLAQLLAGGRTDGLPGPVHALHDLVAGLVVAGKTGLGDFRTGLERPLQFLELAVVRSARRLAARCSDGQLARARVVRRARHHAGHQDQRSTDPATPAASILVHHPFLRRKHLL